MSVFVRLKVLHLISLLDNQCKYIPFTNLTAMFWESAAAYSQINDILSRPVCIVHGLLSYLFLQNLTIKELLDDDDVLQKCREKDPRLINL